MFHAEKHFGVFFARYYWHSFFKWEIWPINEHNQDIFWNVPSSVKYAPDNVKTKKHVFLEALFRYLRSFLKLH